MEAKILTIVAVIAFIAAIAAFNTAVGTELEEVPTASLTFNTDSTAMSIPGTDVVVETVEPFVFWFDQIESVTIRRVDYALGKPTYLIHSFELVDRYLEYPKHWPEHHHAYLKRAL